MNKQARNESLGGENPQAQVLRVAALYDGVENGCRPSLFMKGRGEIKQAIRAAKHQNLSGSEMLARVGATYSEEDLHAVISERRRNNRLTRVATAGALVLGVLVVAPHINGEQSQGHVAASETATDLALDKNSSTQLGTITVTETGSEPPSETTTSVPATQSAVEQTTTSTTIATQEGQAFNQRDFGEVKSVVVDQPLSVEVEQIAQITGDIDPDNRQELYQYVDTLAAYNGIDANHVKTGDRISFKDCPATGDVILKGDTLASFAGRNGVGEDQVSQSNNGNLQAVAGWCGRVIAE